MVTYHDLLTAQPEMFDESAQAWNKWSAAVRDHAGNLKSIASKVAPRWDGLASSTAHSFVTAAHVRAANSASALSNVETCLKDAFGRFAKAHNSLISLHGQATNLGFTVTDAGEVTDPDNVIGQAHGQRKYQLQTSKNHLQQSIHQVVKDATAADDAVAKTLRGLMPPKQTTLAGSSGNGGSPSGGVSYAPPVDYQHSGSIPVPPNAHSLAPNPKAQGIIDYALTKLGSRYVWGAEGPTQFDCSGLTSAAYHDAGIDIPRTSEAQWAAGPRIPDGHEQPGDLVYFNMEGNGPGHVGIVLNPKEGTMIVAPHTGSYVQIQHYKGYPGGYLGFTRPGNQ